jgi:hypothetical protein
LAAGRPGFREAWTGQAGTGRVQCRCSPLDNDDTREGAVVLMATAGQQMGKTRGQQDGRCLSINQAREPPLSTALLPQPSARILDIITSNTHHPLASHQTEHLQSTRQTITMQLSKILSIFSLAAAASATSGSSPSVHLVRPHRKTDTRTQ